MLQHRWDTRFFRPSGMADSASPPTFPWAQRRVISRWPFGRPPFPQRLTRIAELPRRFSEASDSRRWLEYLSALTIAGICTAIAFPLYPRFDSVNVVMLYLLGTTVAALRLGRGPSALLAVANILGFDYFFVPPTLSFDVADTQYLFTLAVMLIVALVIAHLMVSIRRHRDISDAREQRTAMLYAMSRELSTISDAQSMAGAAARHITSAFQSTAAVLMADERGFLSEISPVAESAGIPSLRLSDFDFEVAREVAAGGERCIRDAIYLPFWGSRHVKGVIVVRPQPRSGTLPKEQLELLDAFAAQLAVSLQRVHLTEAAEAARIAAERTQLRNTLLASISHDLRTPLSAIAGAGSLIAQPNCALNDDRRTTLGQLIERKARDMSQLLSNVLELVKMESGDCDLCTDWHTIDDLIAHSLRENAARLSQWRIALNLPADSPLILVEATLIVQILNNLLENVAKYTPPGTTVTISAAMQEQNMLLVVSDNGPGLPSGDAQRLFEKFQRGRTEGNVVGVGLGLAICRAAARLHGGDIRATDNSGGGARFEITLPVQIQNEIPSMDRERVLESA